MTNLSKTRRSYNLRFTWNANRASFVSTNCSARRERRCITYRYTAFVIRIKWGIRSPGRGRNGINDKIMIRMHAAHLRDASWNGSLIIGQECKLLPYGGRCTIAMPVLTVRLGHFLNNIMNGDSWWSPRMVKLAQFFFRLRINALWARCSIVIESLWFKPEGRGFETRWGYWIYLSIYLTPPAALWR
jgi:hypothetical protein